MKKTLLLVLALIAVGCGESAEARYDTGWNDGYAAGYNTTCEIRATMIEGDWDEVFACVKACHQVVHDKGSIRIYTTLKVNTRIDRKQSFREKVPSVEAVISSNVNPNGLSKNSPSVFGTRADKCVASKSDHPKRSTKRNAAAKSTRVSHSSSEIIFAISLI